MSFFLEELKLKNFRSYEQAKYQFSPHRNIIVGLKAVGKTNLVEAVYCLCFTKSFKNNKDADLIKFGSSFFNLKGKFSNFERTDNVLLSYDGKDKRIQKDNYVYKTISDYLGYVNAIVFSPDDLELVKGAPSVRRRFLDTNIGQINKEYLQASIKYKNVLKERNEFLKSVVNEKTDDVLLDVITKGLIEYGKIIIKKRNAFVSDLNTYIKPNIKTISKEAEEIKIVYKPNTNVDNLWKTANEKKFNDLMMKTTTWGPTRDDFEILVNGHLAANYCSQGQIRTATLAIKLALAEYIKQKNERIIVILDDVFSELDNERQNQVLKLLDNNNQTFITTTTIESIDDAIKKESLVIEIERGNDND